MIKSENGQQFRAKWVILWDMGLDFQRCYAATQSRDARFDGRFFVAVVTTGIYCRPICPAIMPRPENIRFFVSAAAAAEAGFRPCLRCRPEASPGTPDWQGSSSTVSRALRLISEGVLDEAGVNELARRLNIGPRHLRRLFVEHLGASPIAVAQTRRNHFAKKLIDETMLPMSEVAFCAGFSSIRRFNAAMRRTYGRAPTELRRTQKQMSPTASEANLQLKLSYRPPLDWQSLIRFLQARAIPGVEAISADRYRRTVHIGEATGIIQVQPGEGAQYLLLQVPPELSRGLMQISERVRNLFDLRADPMQISSHLTQDKRMAELVQSHPGLRIPGAWDGFEIAVRAIVGQQVSVKAANTLAGRLVKAYGQPLQTAGDDELAYLFPCPDRLADADFSATGLMPQRAEAIRGLARAVRDGHLAFGTAVGLEEAIACLTALPGVGAWTAHYIAMRALGEPDAFPSGDLALRRAAAEKKGNMLTEAQLRERAEPWRPWRAYAAMYLWQHYATR
jgi:AraC family transcriptional regulator of adaptative response / DNA-3-methyladenine glycosylase II